MNNFNNGVKVTLSDWIDMIDGKRYLPWATALALAKNPVVSLVEFDDKMPMQTFFNGAVVAVENEGQRVYLPITDQGNQPIPSEAITLSDINRAIGLCRAKSVAIVNGLGMCLYSRFGEDADGFFKAMERLLYPDICGFDEPEVVGCDRSGPLDWAAAVSAMRMTDGESRFEIRHFVVVDKESGRARQLPYQVMQGEYIVSLRVTYKGRPYDEMEPIVADTATKESVVSQGTGNGCKVQPTVSDWERAVTNCLIRAIIAATGHGLYLFTEEQRLEMGLSVPAP